MAPCKLAVGLIALFVCAGIAFRAEIRNTGLAGVDAKNSTSDVRPMRTMYITGDHMPVVRGETTRNAQDAQRTQRKTRNVQTGTRPKMHYPEAHKNEHRQEREQAVSEIEGQGFTLSVAKKAVDKYGWQHALTELEAAVSDIQGQGFSRRRAKQFINENNGAEKALTKLQEAFDAFRRAGFADGVAKNEITEWGAEEIPYAYTGLAWNQQKTLAKKPKSDLISIARALRGTYATMVADALAKDSLVKIVDSLVDVKQS